MPGTTPLSAAITLKEIAEWDGKSQEIYKALPAVFDAKDYLECIKDLKSREIDPQLYINNLNQIIDSLPADPELRGRCIRALRKACGFSGILPACYKVPFSLSKVGSRAFMSGSFGDVWKYTHEGDRDRMFAVKNIRVFEVDPIEKINKKYCKEVVIWKRAEHPNILAIVGVAPGLYEFCMVSEWMENGNMLDYVRDKPNADRFGLLVGVTCGLDYLHSNDVIHGDLKGQNIVIDQKLSPRLADFGLSSITKNIASVNASTPNAGGTVHYRAPELFGSPGDATVKSKKVTKESDMYSLSMVIVELVTGRVPFFGLTDYAIMRLVSKGERPQKPDVFDAPGMTPPVWKIAKECWHGKAKHRPDVKAVLRRLENMEALTGDERTISTFKKWLRGTF